jgi:chorismate mutase
MSKPDLLDIRQKIDAIDEKIVELYKERIDVLKEVAEYKKANAKPVLDIAREEEKISSLKSKVEGDFYKKAVEELYGQIMSTSRLYQYSLIDSKEKSAAFGFKMLDELPKTDGSAKVVYQGIEGAYSNIVAKKYFADKAKLYNVRSFEEAIIEVLEERADYALLPIFNSSAGAVWEVYDLLRELSVYIVADYEYNVEHALMTIEGSSLSDIKSVCSHIQALSQCKEYLAKHRDWQKIEIANTALAAKKVKDDKDPTQAAIAAKEAAGIYGLKILKEQVNKFKHNTTRFVAVTKDKIYQSSASKLSISFELKHKPGTLYKILAGFLFNDINMLKIESRPIPERVWEYRFFVDIEGSLHESNVKDAIYFIEQNTKEFRILGNY